MAAPPRMMVGASVAGLAVLAAAVLFIGQFEDVAESEAPNSQRELPSVGSAPPQGLNRGSSQTAKGPGPQPEPITEAAPPRPAEQPADTGEPAVLAINRTLALRGIALGGGAEKVSGSSVKTKEPKPAGPPPPQVTVATPEVPITINVNIGMPITGSTMILPMSDAKAGDFGFGLYTHILLTPADPARNRAFLAALAGRVPQVDAPRLPAAKRSQLNVFVTPTTTKRAATCMRMRGIEQDVDEAVLRLQTVVTTPDDIAAFREALYDYELAGRLLLGFGVEHGRGPFLMTYYEPVTALDQLSKGVLLADLSTRHDAVFPHYTALYLSQVKRPAFWDAEHLDSWALAVSQMVIEADEGLTSLLGVVGGIVRTAQAKEPAAIRIAPAAGAPLGASCDWLTTVLEGN